MDNKKQVQYYSKGQFSSGERPEQTPPPGTDSAAPEGASSVKASAAKAPFPSWAKALIIAASVIIFLVILGVGCGSIISGMGSAEYDSVVTDFGHDYIGTLYVEDTLDEYGTGLYDHQYTLNAIDAMIKDSHNKGMMLYINTPGGTVYASDELYLKIKEYRESTGRPVYASMQSQATSGGYYISAACDKVIANRNCWTGSIGVTMGSFIDISELLANLGIKTQTITSGSNKAMGSTTEPMTDEQRQIFQSLIDEAYEQFVGIVAEGRGMSTEQVRALADGRLYSAQQAVNNGLVDRIGTYEEAVSDMMSSYSLEDCTVEDFRPDYRPDLSSLLGIIASQQPKGAGSGDLSGGSLQSSSLQGGKLTDAEAIEALIALNGTFRVSYISNVVK